MTFYEHQDNGYFGLRTSLCDVDVFPYHKKDKKKKGEWYCSYHKLPPSVDKCKNSREIFPLSEGKLEKELVPTPHNCEKHLAAIYGDGWKTPKEE